MFKFLTIALAATAIGAGYAATAEACGGSCSSGGMAIMSAAPTAATGMAGGAYRSYSYEHSIGPLLGPSRSYSRPMMRGGSGRPSYLLPKSDPRRYR